MDSPQPPVLPETVVGGLTPGEIRAVTHERLRLLSWGYFITGGMGILISSFLLIYVVLLGALSMIPASEWESSSSHRSQQGEHLSDDRDPSVQDEGHAEESPSTSQNRPSSGPPSVWIFRIFAGMMLVFVLIGWTISGLTIYAGRCIRQRRNRMLILVMAGFNLMSVPFGTLLGICTFLVLQSDPGRREFELA
jgi:hypothetical protein